MKFYYHDTNNQIKAYILKLENGKTYTGYVILKRKKYTRHNRRVENAGLFIQYIVHDHRVEFAALAQRYVVSYAE